MEQVSPTRTELLTRQGQIHLARQGADLLRSKREALVREFLAELKSFAQTRKAVQTAMIEAIQTLIVALAIDGAEAIKAAAFGCRKSFALDVQEENIWGTTVVNVETDYSAGTLTGATARISEASEQFEKAVELILRIAPVELKLRAFAEEIQKTSRRVNALEQRLLPRLNEQVRFIRNMLDQREREDIFRLKRLKREADPGG